MRKLSLSFTPQFALKSLISLHTRKAERTMGKKSRQRGERGKEKEKGRGERKERRGLKNHQALARQKTPQATEARTEMDPKPTNPYILFPQNQVYGKI